jgi:hypothetical protein
MIFKMYILYLFYKRNPETIHTVLLSVALFGRRGIPAWAPGREEEKQRLPGKRFIESTPGINAHRKEAEGEVQLQYSFNGPP